jgi:hypothetical protein
MKIVKKILKTEIDAGYDFLNNLNNHKHVIAAYWTCHPDNEKIYLCVALEDLESNIDYRKILSISEILKKWCFDPLRVKIVDTENSTSKFIQDIHIKYPGKMFLNFDVKTLPDILYIYPKFRKNYGYN